ncbi:unnamed protein product [Fusarium equiseti]|uniref:Heterokaryon incompatibility domain-containing protein n=1 Tax=Fusarium equiseti TaxID=61235 RepID=A0A8J2ISW0_FUSEQ|nr:unnamed protein product [Fusarium equiseti]
MAYTGVRLDDLQEGARHGCDFGEYLVSHLQEGYPEGLSWHEMKLYTNGVEFYGLLPLEKAVPSDHGPELPPEYHYIPVPAHKQGRTRGSAKLPMYFLSRDQDAPESRGQFKRDWKPIVTDPLMDRTVASIKDWRVRCESNQALAHTICSRPGPEFLPSRLIAIERNRNNYQVKLVNAKLLEIDSEYTALSYCWGGALQAALKRENFASYQERISWDRIPKTIQDAIITTERLGIHHIWVDSFCIIQDSDDDKKEEISQMSQVYTHSAVTIIARRAANAHNKDGQKWQWILTFDLPAGKEDETILDTRGWALQEYLLSRRVLIIGTWTTVWSCPKERYENCDGWNLGRVEGDPFFFRSPWSLSAVEGSVFEDKHELDVIAFFSAYKDVQHLRPNDRSVREAWETLVSQYTQRSLSESSDRILAISGLAELFSHLRGGKYAAGLWVQDLPSALCWHYDSDILYPRPSVKQGPSWSWTAINGPIASGDLHGRALAKVESVESELTHHKSPFGSVARGILKISGPACSLAWGCAEQKSSPDLLRLGFPVAGGYSFDTGVEFISDAYELEPGTTWLLATLIAIQVDDYCVEGIVLREEPDDTMSQQPQLNPAHDPFQKLPPEVLRLITRHFCAHCCGEYDQPFKVESSVQDTTTLYNLCLASPCLRDNSQQILFHYFGVESIYPLSVGHGWKWRLGPFLRTVASRPDLARSVKIAGLHWRLLNQLSFNESKTIFDQCAKSLGTSALSIFLNSRSGQESQTNTIRQSFLLRGSIPRGVRPGQWLPVMASELLTMLLALLPNISYLGVMEDAEYFRNPNILEGRGWRLDVSVPTLDALGIDAIGLKTIESDYRMEKLLKRATSLETFVIGGGVDGPVPEMPSLKHLHILRWVRHFPTTSYLLKCTGQLKILSYRAPEPDISMVVRCLDHPRFHDSLESIRFDFRCKASERAIQPMPSLKQFSKLKAIFLPTRAIWGCYSTEFEPQSLINILPPSIESLTLMHHNTPTSSGPLCEDMLRLLEAKPTSFTQLRTVISDSSEICNPTLMGLFKQVGVTVIFQELPRYTRRYTGQDGHYEDESLQTRYAWPHDMSPDPDL